jgi:hypothetical protein
VSADNRRSGSKRTAPSSVRTPEGTAPLESRRQRRALNGPVRYRYAIVSNVRDADAGPVQVLRKGKRGRPRKHRDEPGRFTRDIGGSTPCEYVYGTG